ncbi:MAG: rhodanese-like domain-containing protein [Pseudomonadota bacterium]
MKANLLLVFGFFLTFTSGAWGMERFDVLTTQEVKQMLDQREAGTLDFLLVNTLDEMISNDSSIPGSVKVPWSKVSTFAYRLGTDKNRLIVTYCMGYR